MSIIGEYGVISNLIVGDFWKSISFDSVVDDELKNTIRYVKLKVLIRRG